MAKTDAPVLDTAATTAVGRGSYLAIFGIFLRLGLTSFGGPVAHLGYFRQEFVERRRWLSESAYADLVALCQFLPGPASSQVGVGIGLARGGPLGAIAAWTGFTVPSAVVLTLCGMFMANFGALLSGPVFTGMLHGLLLVALAVVAQAVWSMSRSLCPDRARQLIAVIVAIVIIARAETFVPLLLLVLAGGVGAALRGANTLPHMPLPLRVRPWLGCVALSLYGLLLAVALLASFAGDSAAGLFLRFYRAGALVFGGGHVVLPILEAQVVPQGMMTNATFLAGYGVAQAVPGPLFSFAAYLGAASALPPTGWFGAVICVVAIFLPGCLLVIGVLPFWEKLRSYAVTAAVMRGINAAVVGILLAALYRPVGSTAIERPIDLVSAGLALWLLAKRGWAPWLVVGLAAALGAALGLVGSA